MSNWSTSTEKDLSLTSVKNNATYLVFCSAIPTTYTQAFSTYMLAQKSISSADWTGPQDGIGTERQVIYPALSSLTPTNSGTVTCYAFINSTNSTLIRGGDVNPSFVVVSGTPCSTSEIVISAEDA